VYYCAYSGSFGENTCNPRTLSSSLLNRMVSLEGIVTKCSLVRPKVVKSVHWNEKKGTFVFREYRDQTMTANGAASLSVYPQEDEDHNPVSRPRSHRNFKHLTKSSLSLSMAIVPTETTKPSQSKKCLNEPPLVSFRVASM
jgi:DNA replicative helicase MCM subunit Mcm2 (Cdc46/Mcm family)